MLKISVIDPITHPDYDQWIDKFEKSTFFHSSDWAKIIKSTYGYIPTYIIASMNGVIECILPLMEVNSFFTGKRAVGLPFSDYCEPLVNKKDVFDQVLNYGYTLGKKRNWKTIEIRGGYQYLAGQSEHKTYYIHSLELNANVDSIFNSLRDSTRRNIKKAMRSNVTTVSSYDFDAIKKFYDLNCLTRRKHGLPPQPFPFFINIFKNIISKKKGYVVLATIEKHIVAGAIFLIFNDKVIYKYGASDPDFLNSRANNLVMWHSIKLSAENNMKEFNFGRTEKENAGLIQFKDGWGTKKSNIAYYKYEMTSNKYIQQECNFGTKKVNAGLKHFPLFILKAIGKMLYKHVG